MGETIIEMKKIRKLFSGVVVLEDIDFNLQKGEVHALMGENGAGKSTLAKIITGIYQADGGTMLVKGEPCSFTSTKKAGEKGIAIVTQEFSLLPDFSIAENIFLTDNTHYKKGFILNKRSIIGETKKLLELFHMEGALSPYEKIKNLSVAQMQIIEILKAVSTNAEVIILDEPTASLSEKEISQLFDIIREMQKNGVSFIIVSHKLNEIYEISDRITVLRDGKLILNGEKTKELSSEKLIRAMVGREVKDLYGSQKVKSEKEWEKEEVVLEVQGLADQNNYVRDISFQVHKGEIIGFSGLMGAGRTELVRCIFGADPKTKGKILLHGKELAAGSIKGSIRSKIGFVSEDRKQDGLIQEMSVLKNINLATLAASHRFVLNEKKEEEACRNMIERLKIKVADIDLPVKSLSGGNQQKVLLAKWMLLDPEVLIIDEPTRGVDIGAKSDIYTILRELARQGVAIIVVSSEIPEIMGICDNIYIMREGRITGKLAAEEADEEKIGFYSIG